MRIWRGKNLSIVLALLGMLAVGEPVSAQVVSADDPHFGPGSITIDLSTGYQWLDVTLSINRSVADVSAQFGPGGDFEGFRFATKAEVTAFFQSAGLPIGFGFPAAPMQAFIGLVGGLTQSEPGKERLVGRVSTQASPGQHYAPEVGTFLPATSTSGFANPDLCCAPTTLASSNAGNWLVRTASAYGCNGFDAPFATTISLKRKTQRAIPLKMQLSGLGGEPITDLNIAGGPPVVNISFSPATGGPAVDVTSELVSVGHATEGNQFVYATDSGRWVFNLASTPFQAAGTYTVTVASGDSAYTVSPTCSGQFIRLE